MAESDKDISGVITDADIERAKRQIGIPHYVPAKTYNYVADRSSMSHYAFGNGDDNPLWHDPKYGEKTRWRGQIAFPIYPLSAGICVTPRLHDEESKKLFKGLFKGVGKYHITSDWTWYRPIVPNDEIFFEKKTIDVEVKKSSSTNSNSVAETYQYLYVNRFGEPICTRNEIFLSIERSATKDSGKWDNFERATYTKEDIQEIDELYNQERVRGSDTLYWEDVEVGEELQPVVKGPLTVMDIISNHMARGWGGYGVGPLRYASKGRQRMPAFYPTDKYGVPDVAQRLHWDPEWAERIGLPAPVDYGQQRLSWQAHLICNWMGDDGWLLNLAPEFREFNFVGDTTICRGKVVGKRQEGRHCLVDLELNASNQRGVVTCPGKATVMLPSREFGPVKLPSAPEPLTDRGIEMMVEYKDFLSGKP